MTGIETLEAIVEDREARLAEVEKERDEYKQAAEVEAGERRRAHQERDAARAEVARMEKVCDSYADENQRFHDRFTKAETERDAARTALDLYRDAVRIDAMMEGPRFAGADTSALKRAWEHDRSALSDHQTGGE